MYPNVPPIPATEPTARFGNVSETSVYRLELNPWWADSATPTMMTAVHMLCTTDTNAAGTTHRAHTSSVSLRAALTLQPLLIRWLDSQPPAMLPTSAIT